MKLSTQEAVLPKGMYDYRLIFVFFWQIEGIFFENYRQLSKHISSSLNQQR